VAEPRRLDRMRAALARWFGRAVGAPVPAGAVPFGSQSRAYASARGGRTTGGFGSSGNTSADAELALSITQLRARSRQMVRDASFAKRARLLVVNNVIGAGVGMQAQVLTTRDELASRVNDDIESAWCEWAMAPQCHTGGALHFHDLERMAMGEVFTAGEAIIRKHYRSFGGSRIPLGLEVIEPERLAHELVDPGSINPEGEVRMGVEVDVFGRALAYWIRQRHPGDLRGHVGSSDRFERVPASDIFHLRIVDRWPQTRGEPWLHTVLRKIDELNEYTGSEVSAARASSYYFATIKTPDGDQPLRTDEDDVTQQGVMDIEPLTIQELKPGEELDFHKPDRPNTGMDAFLRSMLREVAAGCGVSYESLSRDYSQSNYSSSRLALLDDRDLFKVLQLWWIRNFRQPLHKVWLQQAVLAGALPTLQPAAYATDLARYEAVLFKPRGWTWVDPTKEVAAYKEAVMAGFTTVSDVIAATGGGQDIEDVIGTRKRELEMLAEAGIRVDTTVEAPPKPAAAPAPAAAEPTDPEADDGAAASRGARVMPIKRGTA
jgi:lambda family phage portal protein